MIGQLQLHGASAPKRSGQVKAEHIVFHGVSERHAIESRTVDAESVGGKVQAPDAIHRCSQRDRLMPCDGPVLDVRGNL